MATFSAKILHFCAQLSFSGVDICPNKGTPHHLSPRKISVGNVVAERLAARAAARQYDGSHIEFCRVLGLPGRDAPLRGRPRRADANG